jgi:hypothetical protein
MDNAQNCGSCIWLQFTYLLVYLHTYLFVFLAFSLSLLCLHLSTRLFASFCSLVSLSFCPKGIVLYDVTPFVLIQVYWSFVVPYCLHLRNVRLLKACLVLRAGVQTECVSPKRQWVNTQLHIIYTIYCTKDGTSSSDWWRRPLRHHYSVTRPILNIFLVFIRSQEIQIYLRALVQQRRYTIIWLFIVTTVSQISHMSIHLSIYQSISLDRPTKLSGITKWQSDYEHDTGLI